MRKVLLSNIKIQNNSSDYLFDYLLIEAIDSTGFQSRGRGIRTPMNGFGDRDTAIVWFPYIYFFHVLSYAENSCLVNIFWCIFDVPSKFHTEEKSISFLVKPSTD